MEKPFYNEMIDPVDGSAYISCNEKEITFKGGNTYPLKDQTPVLIHEEDSLFNIVDILNKTVTTQSGEYRDTGNIKNWIRQKFLPVLSLDGKSKERFSKLSGKIKEGRVLVIGAGDKAEDYRKYFVGSEVIISDVHCEFSVELVLDSHHIPFKDNTFSLVLLPQVFEHVSRPWMVAAELERVTSEQGLIQIEVPFAFMYHGAPYDFYRFTPSALFFLFPHCDVDDFQVPEGNWGGAANAVSSAMIDTFSNRYLRMTALAFARITLFWMKYMDRIAGKRSLSFPKGFALTYIQRGIKKDEKQILQNLDMFLNRL